VSFYLGDVCKQVPIPTDPARRAGRGATRAVLDVYVGRAHHCGVMPLGGLSDEALSTATGYGVPTCRMARRYLERLGILRVVRLSRALGRAHGATPVEYVVDVTELRRRWAGRGGPVWAQLERLTRGYTCHPVPALLERATPSIERATSRGLSPIERATSRANGRATSRAHRTDEPTTEKDSPTTWTGTWGQPDPVALEALGLAKRIVAGADPPNDPRTAHLNGATVPAG